MDAKNECKCCDSQFCDPIHGHVVTGIWELSPIINFEVYLQRVQSTEKKKRLDGIKF